MVTSKHSSKQNIRQSGTGPELLLPSTWYAHIAGRPAVVTPTVGTSTILANPSYVKLRHRSAFNALIATAQLAADPAEFFRASLSTGFRMSALTRNGLSVILHTPKVHRGNIPSADGKQSRHCELSPPQKTQDQHCQLAGDFVVGPAPRP